MRALGWTTLTPPVARTRLRNPNQIGLWAIQAAPIVRKLTRYTK